MKRLRQRVAFTIIEVMLAIGIFSAILMIIYSIWSGIIRASQAARSAADSAQRGRIAIKTLEDALTTAQMFSGNMPPVNYPYYGFLAKADGDFTSLSFVAHLPATFPGVGRYGDNIVRRVSFWIEPGKEGHTLKMSQVPMMLAKLEGVENFEGGIDSYQLDLAKNVQFFILEFWGRNKETREEEWVAEWDSTNSLPRLVRIGLGLGKKESPDLTYSVVALPASAIPPEWQGVQPGGVRPGQMPGQMPPGTQLPGGGGAMNRNQRRLQ